MMPPAFGIRRATPDDAQALSALMHGSSAYRGAYSRILDGYEVTPWQIERDHVYLAADEEAILGFYSLAYAGTHAELDLMFVADAAQGAGIGARLFAHMRSMARDLELRRVKIVSHPPAENFYLRMGAVRVGVREASGRVGWARPILALDIGADKDS